MKKAILYKETVNLLNILFRILDICIQYVQARLLSPQSLQIELAELLMTYASNQLEYSNKDISWNISWKMQTEF